MKKNLEKVVLVVGLLLVIVIAFFAGQEKSDFKNKKYIEETYPSMRDLIRMKFERDAGVGSNNSSIYSLQDPQDDYIFYLVAHDPISLERPILNKYPINHLVYKVDLRNIPNYLNLNNSLVYYPSNLKLILSFDVPKEERQIDTDISGKSIMELQNIELMIVGLDSNKLILAKGIHGYKTETYCDDFYHETFKDSLYSIDIDGNFTQIPKPYTMTSSMKDYLMRNNKQCTENVEKNYETARNFYEGLEKSQ